jgi:D-beta-D-heptose 7-phosphate kinase/D-beta-D-heptose 1-phosphate adenosyltransferase
VGLNSDNSIKKLKGKDRPIQGEDARAQVLASLETVDLVIVFGEDTPLNLIQNILPEILVKGSDYTEEEVIGADIILRNGGKILLTTLEPGYSTTNTISRLKE